MKFVSEVYLNWWTAAERSRSVWISRLLIFAGPHLLLTYARKKNTKFNVFSVSRQCVFFCVVCRCHVIKIAKFDVNTLSTLWMFFSTETEIGFVLVLRRKYSLLHTFHWDLRNCYTFILMPKIHWGDALQSLLLLNAFIRFGHES